MSKQPKKSTKPASDKIRIGVSFDFDSKYGFFLKADLAKRLSDLNIEIVPLLNAGDLDHLVPSLEGVLLPGGVGDVDPQLYGQSKKHEEVKIVRDRCDLEYRILDKFLPTKKPILGVCWGHQLLNVYFGGSLIQDIQKDFESKIAHQQSQPIHEPTHYVWLECDGKARELFGGKPELHVNSTHHQAVDKLSSELILEGRSPDAMVEAFRHASHDFLWGVQWHPERLMDDPIIPAFLKACRRLR